MCISGLAPQHGRQLPGQVVGILDAGIGAEAAAGRDDVGRVANEEDTPGAVLLRHLSPDRKSQHLDVGARDLGPDRNVHLRQSGSGPNQRDDPLVGIVGARLPGGVVAGAEDPALSGLVVGHQDRSWLWLPQIGDVDPPSP